MSFLKETICAIKESDHKTSDVSFIGSLDGKYRISFKQFKKIANFDYDSGFGSPKIAIDLIICFKDNTYIKRGEYDGSEWWEYNEPLKLSKIFKEFTNLGGGSEIMWETVEDLNTKLINEN